MPYSSQWDREVNAVSAEVVNPMDPYTVEDWLAEDPPPDGSKRELILGKIRVSPFASTGHNAIGDELCALFKSALRLAGVRGRYPVTNVNLVLSAARRTAVVPDLAILNVRPGPLTVTPQQVELVAEIWSPSNRNRDRSEKLDAYAQAGIRYFWVLETAGPVVHAYELRAGRYHLATTLRDGTAATITAAPVPVTFDPADLLVE
jgi:Uma2 family endonuclease